MGNKETLVLTNPKDTTLNLKVSSITLSDTEEASQYKKIFFTVTNGSTFHVASPVTCGSITTFDEKFSVKFESSEQVTFKVLGISVEGTECIIGTVKYHV